MDIQLKFAPSDLMCPLVLYWFAPSHCTKPVENKNIRNNATMALEIPEKNLSSISLNKSLISSFHVSKTASCDLRRQLDY